MLTKKLICMILAISVLLSTSVFNVVYAADTSSVSSKEQAESQLGDLESQIAEYEKKQQEIQSKIDEVKNDSANYDELRNSLSEKIESMKDQMNLVDSEISKYDTIIEKNEMDIYKKNVELRATKEELKKRLRALYIAGPNNALEILLSSNDFGNFLARSEMLRGVSDHDKKLMDNLIALVKEINKMKDANNQDKEKSSALKAQLEEKRSEYDKEYNEAGEMLTKLSGQKTTLYEDSAELAESIEQKKAEAEEWRAFIKNNSSNFEFGSQKEEPKVEEDEDDDEEEEETKPTKPSGNNSSSSSSFGFSWPFQSSYYISCQYGGYAGHTGVDISCSGALGKPIYAAASGYIIRATWSNVSYGNCLIIDHGVKDGDSYSTLYAHCDSLLVDYGDYVEKGQLIAYCGSTGNSTGPHLHFELRINGDDVDPLDYVSRP